MANCLLTICDQMCSCNNSNDTVSCTFKMWLAIPIDVTSLLSINESTAMNSQTTLYYCLLLAYANRRHLSLTSWDCKYWSTAVSVISTEFLGQTQSLSMVSVSFCYKHWQLDNGDNKINTYNDWIIIVKKLSKLSRLIFLFCFCRRWGDFYMWYLLKDWNIITYNQFNLMV